jgi:hypothetical protein
MARVKDQVGKGETLTDSFKVVHSAAYGFVSRLAKIAERLEEQGNVIAGEAIRKEIAGLEKPIEEWETGE